MIWLFKGLRCADAGVCVAGLVTKPKPYKVRIVPRSKTAKGVVLDTLDKAKTDILDFDSVELL